MRDSVQAGPTLTVLSDGERPAIAADIANDMEAEVLNIGKEGVVKVMQTIAAHHIRAALPDLEAGQPGGTERAREHMEQALAASEMLEKVTAAPALQDAKAVLQGGNVRAAG